MNRDGVATQPHLPPPIQDQCGSYTFIPYTVTAHGEVLCCDSSAEQCPAELPQPGCGTEPCTPLTARLIRLLEAIPTNSWYQQPPLLCTQRRAAGHVP